MDRELGVGGCTVLHLEWINNEVLLFRTGNHIQSPGVNSSGREYKRVQVRIKLSHFALQRRSAQHCKSTTLQQKSRHVYGDLMLVRELWIHMCASHSPVNKVESKRIS